MRDLAAVLLPGAFLLGAGLAPPPGAFGALAGFGAALLVLGLSRPRFRVALSLAAALLGGQMLAALDAAERASRTWGWLPLDGRSIERAFVGEVLACPESGPEGEWRFRAALRPHPEPVPGAPAAVVRLTVSGSGDPASPIERLRSGDRIRLWARLGRPRSPGNPGDADARAGLVSRGEDATGWVKSPRVVEVLEEGPPSLSRSLDAARVAARRRLDLALGPSGEARALAGAMLLGDRAAFPSQLERSLRESGLSHLIAVSGLHVAIVCAMLLTVLRPLRRLPVLSAVLLGSAVFLYAGLAGAAPPVARASCMAGLALAARACGRSSTPLSALALAAAFLVALHPFWVWHAGFRLSVAAVAGIVTLSAPLARRPVAPRSLRGALAVSAAAYAATAPFLAENFQRLSPAALWVNPPAILAATVFLAAAACSAAAHDLPILGPLAVEIAERSSAILVRLAETGSGGVWSTLRVPPPSPLLWTAHGISWTLLAAAPSRLRRTRSLSASILLFALAAMHLGAPPHRGPPRLAVLDVGQGQAVAVFGEEGRCFLVDAAGSAGGRFDVGERVLAPLLVREGCRRLDILAVTHGHDDHVGGAVAVLRDLEVGELWIPVGSARDAGIRDAANVAAARGTAVRLAGRGDRRRVEGWEIEATAPSREDIGLPLNDRGLVLRLTGPGGGHALIPGDLEREGEERLLRSRRPIAAEVLVAGHHGARGSSTEAWIAAVRPRIVIVSAGSGNRFGHPHEEALERFRNAGARVFRTDRDGQVRLTPGADAWAVEVTVRRDGMERE
jgi:competence protein ComEC